MKKTIVAFVVVVHAVALGAWALVTSPDSIVNFYSQATIRDWGAYHVLGVIVAVIGLAVGFVFNRDN